jgi:hypothetical protein
MPYSDLAKNLMLDHLAAGTVSAANIGWVSLHDGHPGPVGLLNELAVSRVAITFGTPAAGGAISHTGSDPVFPSVPAASNVCYVSFWSLAAGGIYYGYVPVNGGSVDGVGSISDVGPPVDTITAPGHGLVDDDRVQLSGPVGEALPAGYSDTTLYHVVGSDADTFQVALTQSGAAVDPQADGMVYFQKIIPEVFGAIGSLTLNTSTLKLEE